MADLHWQWSGAAWVAYTGGGGGGTIGLPIAISDVLLLEARLATLEAAAIPADGAFVPRWFIPATLGTPRPVSYATDGSEPVVWVFPGETDPTFMVAGDFHLEL